MESTAHAEDSNSDYLEEVVATVPERERDPLRLGMQLIRLGRLSEVLFQQSAAGFGLNAAEATTLSVLLLSGPPHEMLPSEIQRRVVHTSAGITGILRRLEARQLVNRRPDQSDGRCIVVALTPDGYQLVRLLLRHRATLFAGYFADIDSEDLPGLIEAIGLVLTRLERAAGYSPAFRKVRLTKQVAST